MYDVFMLSELLPNHHHTAQVLSNINNTKRRNEKANTKRVGSQLSRYVYVISAHTKHPAAHTFDAVCGFCVRTINHGRVHIITSHRNYNVMPVQNEPGDYCPLLSKTTPSSIIPLLFPLKLRINSYLDMQPQRACASENR